MAPAEYFLCDEVVIHNDTSSAWVIVHGTVIDVTPLFRAAGEKKLPLKKSLRWLLALAGKDLSAFFHPSLAPIERVNRNGERVPVFVPAMERNPATGLHWPRDPSLVLGRITFRPCPLRIINTLTFHATEMVVCYEDTIARIRDKFLRYNDNAAQYEWRKDLAFGQEEGKLHLEKTLAENGFQIDLHFRPVSVIWIFYILPPDDSSGESDSESEKCGSTAAAEIKQTAGQETLPGEEVN
ncbi:AGAP010016-PA-like protein [Anopheles sinensis]|uniref:AGAP010016-PA-like protein n=1 Tax=Anopheles sinensis TaxID=74873 RepID=A0A084WQR5_ANOSI|nr:AGAP010016-PA-like protein [Anopheles sinensis]